MSDDTLWRRLAEQRARLTAWQDSLRAEQRRWDAERDALWQQAQQPATADAAIAVLRERLRSQGDLQPWQDWPNTYVRSDDWALFLLCYLADTDIGPQRYLALEMPFNVAWLLRGRAHSYLLWILGTPERCLIVSGTDLWEWIGVHWLRWDEGTFHVILHWDDAAQRCFLHSILQSRLHRRKRQAHLCRRGPFDVTDHLNRYDWLDMT